MVKTWFQTSADEALLSLDEEPGLAQRLVVNCRVLPEVLDVQVVGEFVRVLLGQSLTQQELRHLADCVLYILSQDRTLCLWSYKTCGESTVRSVVLS